MMINCMSDVEGTFFPLSLPSVARTFSSNKTLRRYGYGDKPPTQLPPAPNRTDISTSLVEAASACLPAPLNPPDISTRPPPHPPLRPVCTAPPVLLCQTKREIHHGVLAVLAAGVSEGPPIQLLLFQPCRSAGAQGRGTPSFFFHSGWAWTRGEASL